MKIRYSILVAVFYAAFLLFFAGGRLNSGDAFYQLQASTLLVTTGSLGTRTAPSPNLWFPDKSGVYHEYHDLGQVLFFAPAAWLGSRIETAPQKTLVSSPPRVSRFLVSLAYPLLAACGCWYIWRLYSLFYPLRTAFLLSLVFATATIFFPYSKSAWDVTAGCVGVCAMLFYSARLLRDANESGNDTRDAFGLGIAVAVASLFRLSLTPFLWIGVVGIMAGSKRLHFRTNIGSILLLLLPIAIGLVMSMAYNELRTGSLFQTGATGEHSVLHTLHNSLYVGLYGLLVSPNKGIFLFSPVLLLLLLLPLFWKRLDPNAQRLIGIYSLSGVSYLLLIARLSFWGSFGWGPRYLMPILPIFFLPTGFSLAELMKSRTFRWPTSVLVCLSFFLALAPVLVNWHLAVTQYRGAGNPFANRPYQHMAVWNGLRLATQGKPLPAPDTVLSDPIRSNGRRFPDLWTVRLIEQGGTTQIVGAVLFVLLLSIWSYTLYRLLTRQQKSTILRIQNKNPREEMN